MQFQAFVQDLMMLTGNLMKFKLRMPSFFKKAIYGMTEKTVHDIYTKNDYKDAGVIKTVVEVRELNKKLNTLIMCLYYYRIEDVWNYATAGMLDRDIADIAEMAYKRWERVHQTVAIMIH